MHQPLSFGQLRECLGEAPFTTIERGDHAMADQHADIAAATCLAEARTQASAPLDRLEARHQQVTFVQCQASAHGVQALPRQPLQPQQPLTHFILRPQRFAAGMQHPSPIVVGQGFEQGVADPLGQFQRLSVPPPRTPEVAIGDGQVGQGGQANQALAVALAGQALQSLAAVRLGTFTVTPATGDDATERQPLGQHRLLGRGRWCWQETAEVARKLFGGVQLAGKPQGPAVQHDQPWRADEQAVGQVHFPAQQHADVLFCKQLLLGQALHQVGGHIQVARAQGLLHGLIEQPLPFEPTTRTQVQRHQRLARLTATQQIGEQMVIAEPAPVLVERHQEHLVGLQVAQDL